MGRTRAFGADAVIFDLDVLALDSEEANLWSARKTFYDLDIPLTEAEMKSVVGRSALHYVPEFCRARGITGIEDQKRLVRAAWDNYDLIWSDKVRISAEVKETVGELAKRGKRLALATAERRLVTDRFFRLFPGLRQAFAAVVARDAACRNGNRYLRALTELAAEPDRAVAVEDSEPGLREAKAAGIRCIVIPDRHSKHQDFRQADARLRSLRGLLRAID